VGYLIMQSCNLAIVQAAGAVQIAIGMQSVPFSFQPVASFIPPLARICNPGVCSVAIRAFITPACCTSYIVNMACTF